jgi:hypothetical protein
LIAAANAAIASAGAGGSALRTHLSSSGSSLGAAQPITSAALLVSDTLWVSLDAGSALTDEHRAGLSAAIAELNGKLGPFGVALGEMSAQSGGEADIRIVVSANSPCGGAAEGVLGCASGAGNITLISGWNWYTGAATGAVGSEQYDFRTIITHELAHAVGLSHSLDASSVMYEMLSSGETRRVLTSNDLVLLEAEADGPEALLAAPPSHGFGQPMNQEGAAEGVSDSRSENTAMGRLAGYDLSTSAADAIFSEWHSGQGRIEAAGRVNLSVIRGTLDRHPLQNVRRSSAPHVVYVVDSPIREHESDWIFASSDLDADEDDSAQLSDFESPANEEDPLS